MFAIAIQRFTDNLDALRDFVDLVRPVLEQAHDDEIKSNPKAFIPLMLALEKLAPEIFESSPSLLSDLKSTFGSQIEVTVEDEDESKSVVKIQAQGSDGKMFFKGMKSLRMRKYQISLLYQNALISLVSAAEWFLSQLLHEYFELYPDAAGVRDRSLTLSDLQAIGSVDDARTYLIDLRIEEVIRGSFKDWIHFLKNNLKLSLSYLSIDEDHLTEIYQRRNLLAHNGGIINKIYLSKVSQSVRSDLKVGDLVSISQEYLDKAIDRFERFFLLVSLELWKKISPEDTGRANIITDISFNHLCEERWNIAEGLNYFLVNDKKLPEKKRLIGQINYWQSLKWADRFEEIRRDIEDSDFSAKDEIFTLAKYALLDDEAQFLNLLPSILKAEKITENDLREWPLFRSMRNKDFFRENYSLEASSNSQDIASSDLF